jgi:nucleoside-diphosphate-sugar epimerase
MTDSHPTGKGTVMKIVVIGGTGLIGSKTVDRLREHGHDAVPVSPKSGVNTLTGEGVAEAVAGADVVVDVSSETASPICHQFGCYGLATSRHGTGTAWRRPTLPVWTR